MGRRTFLINDYLLYSTLIGLFTEAFNLVLGFDFRLIYIVIFINYFIITYRGSKFKIPLFWLLSLIYLFITGIITVFLYNNALSGVLLQVFGISFMSIYFYNFLLYYEWDIIDVFEKYCTISFIISLIGIPIFIVKVIFFDSQYRLNSIMTEPAHFCAIVMPAYYYYMVNYNKFKFQFIIILVALFLSFSSIGFLLMLVGLIISRRKINFFVTGGLIFFSIIMALLAYSFSENVRTRANDTFGIVNDFTLSTEVNASTLALASNFYVSFCALESNPLIGRGIGSHQISFKKYVYQITGVEGYENDEALFFLNSKDAASLALRTLSELGLIGFLGILYFIIKNYSSYNDDYKISRAILLYFLYKLFREGHYFSLEMYFFVFTYYFVKARTIFLQKQIDKLQS